MSATHSDSYLSERLNLVFLNIESSLELIRFIDMFYNNREINNNAAYIDTVHQIYSVTPLANVLVMRDFTSNLVFERIEQCI